MAEQKKLTTAEILALARKQGQPGAGAGSPAEAAPQPEAAQSSKDPEAAQPAPAKPETAKPETAKPAATPKSTADILAAARAQAAGAGQGATKPAAGAAPKGTADILAAARAQGAGAAKPAAAPKSTADILAAARAQGANAGAGAKPAAAPPSQPAPKAAAAATGDKPALKDMVAAVKAVSEGKPAVQPRLPVAAKPRLPQKPEQVTRRSFWAMLSSVTITPFAMAWGLMAGIGGLWSLGIARFMMPNMVLELPSRFKVGPPSDFPPGTVSEKYKASRGIWIVHSDQYNGEDMIYALASVCTHLGCTPNWLEGEQKFKCPCHGSGFYVSGINFEGPAPRPLERVGLRRSEDGMLEVDKSVKFQEELGQWADPKSYFPIA